MSAEEKVSKNAKSITLGGLLVVGTLSVLFVLKPEAVAENVVLATITGVIGFLAGAADKLWGK
jgi:hypothetical protein